MKPTDEPTKEKIKGENNLQQSNEIIKAPKAFGGDVENKKPLISRFLVRFRDLTFYQKVTFLFIATFILLVSGLFGYFCWFDWLPNLWEWGFSPLSFKAILAVLGAIYLIIIPFLPLYYFFSKGDIFEIFTEEAEKRHAEEQNKLNDEEELFDELIKEDSEKLVRLTTFSRIELNRYYETNLSQTKRSYRSCMAAMWIGFSIISFGIILFLKPSLLTEKGAVEMNFTILTIGSGVVIEIIAALFLWIYKSSLEQSTYFYNRQIFIHNTLLAFRIANTMKEPDQSKNIIIEKMLDFALKTYQPTKINNKGSAGEQDKKG